MFLHLECKVMILYNQDTGKAILKCDNTPVKVTPAKGTNCMRSVTIELQSVTIELQRNQKVSWEFWESNIKALLQSSHSWNAVSFV